RLQHGRCSRRQLRVNPRKAPLMCALALTRASKRVMNIGHFLKQSADLYPERQAIRRGERSWSWSEFNARVDAACVALARKGVGKGDRVMVQSRNSSAMLETMFTVFKLGAVWVPVNFRLMPEEVAYIAQASGASTLLYDSKFVSHADASLKAASALKLVV